MNTQKESINAQLAEMKSFLAAKVKAEPGNAEAWRELAQVKMMEGDIGGAENDCIECLRLNPKNAAGLVLMGNLLSNAKGDDAAAERYYARTSNSERCLAESPSVFHASFRERVVGRDRRARRFRYKKVSDRPAVGPCHTMLEIPMKERKYSAENLSSRADNVWPHPIPARHLPQKGRME